MTTTDLCSHCLTHFALRSDGTVRVHADGRGNRCDGSGRWPAVEVAGPWVASA